MVPRQLPAEPEDPGAADRQSSDTRVRILDAALTEFGLRGFAGARVDQIAERASANKQLIYYYFKSKAGLYEAALARLMSRTREDYPPGAQQDLRDYLHQTADPVNRGSADWHRVWLWEALERGDKDIIQEEGRRKVWARTVRHVIRAQAEGVVDAKFDPEMLSLALLGMTIVPHILPQITQLMTGDSHRDPEFRVRQAEFVDQLLAHLAPVQSPPHKAGKRPAKKSAADR